MSLMNGSQFGGVSDPFSANGGSAQFQMPQSQGQQNQNYGMDQAIGRGVKFGYDKIKAGSGAASTAETTAAEGVATTAGRTAATGGTSSAALGVAAGPLAAGGLSYVGAKMGGASDEKAANTAVGSAAGAAIGTAILPGVGTVVGGMLGNVLGSQFGE